MKRLIYNDLLKWKNKKNRKPLIITGVRQCGKTYIVKEFGTNEFKNIAYLNFERNPQIANIFEKDFDTQRIITEISNLYVDEKITKDTLIFFDEIQIQPKAITSLKYFAEDVPDQAIICAGSLLGVSLRANDAAFPVGKIERLNLYPMNFYEFILANKKEGLVDFVKNNDKNEPLPSYIMDEFLEVYINYLIVGGMPEAVKSWVADKDIQQVNEIQDNILFGYENDFAKHAPKTEINNIHAIWKSIPEQLAKENNKFVFSHVKKSARAKDLEKSIGWLIDAGLIHLLNKVENANIPLSANNDATFYKVYFCDIGLLCRKANFTLNSIFDSTKHTSGFRGSLIENFANNELISQYKHPYFWKSSNTAELDFLIENNGKIIPIETKANINTQAKSFSQFISKYKTYLGFKFSLKNIGVNTEKNSLIYSIPLFLMWQIDEYLKIKK